MYSAILAASMGIKHPALAGTADPGGPGAVGQVGANSCVDLRGRYLESSTPSNGFLPRGITVVCLNCDFLTDVSGLDKMATHLNENQTHTCQVIVEHGRYFWGLGFSCCN